MDVFREWMLTLVFLGAGGSLLEQAAPDGSLKKYVSFIISMVLLNGLLYPLQTMK